MKSYKKIIESLGRERVVVNELLNKYSSFRLGGPADLFFKAKTVDELVCAVSIAKINKIPLFIMSGGTNLLISDDGFRGLVIKNETDKIRLVGVKGDNKIRSVFLEADSGVGVNRLVRYTLEQGLSGLEPFLGQPGSIGGAIWINAHNMRLGKYFGDSVYSAIVLDENCEMKKVSKSYFNFGYDESILQKTHETVLSVVFKLETGDGKSLWKKATMAQEYRSNTQPKGVFSSGCTFRNISQSDAIRLSSPNYTRSAGFILESLGLKGKTIGGAMYSCEHANFIVHKGQTKASDVLELIKLAKKLALEKYSIDLKEEIVLVGF